MQITLPGYDYKIPKFIYEERQDSSNKRLIEWIKMNIGIYLQN